MFCSKCGKEIADGEKFCKYCGNPVGTGQKTAGEAGTEHPENGTAAPDRISSPESAGAPVPSEAAFSSGASASAVPPVPKASSPAGAAGSAPKISNKKIGIIITAAVAALVLIIVAVLNIGGAKFKPELSKYVTVSAKGLDKNGTLNYYLNYNACVNEYVARNKDVSSVNVLAFENALQSAVKLKVSKTQNLSNGETVQITAVIDNNQLKPFDCKCTFKTISYKVSGLKTAKVLSNDDIFQGISVKFSGTSPAGSASLTGQNPYFSMSSYAIDKKSGLKLGDIITVTCSVKDHLSSEPYYTIAKNVTGKKTFTVSGISEAKVMSDADLFNGIDVKFSGIAPGVKAEITGKNQYLNANAYKLDKYKSLKAGDTVTVTCEAGDHLGSSPYYSIAKDATKKKTFTIKGVTSYISSVKMLPKDALDAINKSADSMAEQIIMNKQVSQSPLSDKTSGKKLSDAVTISDMQLYRKYVVCTKDGSTISTLWPGKTLYNVMVLEYTFSIDGKAGYTMSFYATNLKTDADGKLDPGVSTDVVPGNRYYDTVDDFYSRVMKNWKDKADIETTN